MALDHLSDAMDERRDEWRLKDENGLFVIMPSSSSSLGSSCVVLPRSSA